MLVERREKGRRASIILLHTHGLGAQWRELRGLWTWFIISLWITRVLKRSLLCPWEDFSWIYTWYLTWIFYEGSMHFHVKIEGIWSFYINFCWQRTHDRSLTRPISIFFRRKPTSLYIIHQYLSTSSVSQYFSISVFLYGCLCNKLTQLVCYIGPFLEC